MPTVCRFKPIRTHPRPFRKADAIRVICKVLNGPAEGRIGLPSTQDESTGTLFEITSRSAFDRDLAAIVAEVKARCSPGTSDARPQIEVEQSAQRAIEALELAEREAEANSGLLGNLLDILGAIITFVTLVAGVLRFVPFPPLRLAALAIPRLLSRVEGFLGTVVARKAANDTAWTIYQRTIQALKQAA